MIDIPIWFIPAAIVTVVGTAFAFAYILRSIIDAPYKHILKHEESFSKAQKEILSEFFIIQNNGEYKVKCNTFGMDRTLVENSISSFNIFVEIHYGYKVEEIINNALKMADPTRASSNNPDTQKRINDAKNNRVIGGQLSKDYVSIYWGGDLEYIQAAHISHNPHVLFDERGYDPTGNMALAITEVKYYSTETGKEIEKPITNAVSSAWSIKRGFE